MVAFVFGWPPHSFYEMSFHELVMLWYPRAIEMHRETEKTRTAGMMVGMLKGFSSGR